MSEGGRGVYSTTYIKLCASVLNFIRRRRGPRGCSLTEVRASLYV